MINRPSVGLVGFGRVNSALATLLSSSGLGEVTGVMANVNAELAAFAARNPHIPVGTDMAQVFGRARPDVVVIATKSRLSDVDASVTAACAYTDHIVCTSEELAFALPHELPSEIRDLIADRLSLVSIGLNPGWVFDTLPLFLTAVLPAVRSMTSLRTVDVSGFGATVLRNLGIGYTKPEFENLVHVDRIRGHIGFERSISLLARKLRWRVESIEKTMEPILTLNSVDMASMHIEAGHVAGVIQLARAFVDNDAVITFEFTAHVAPRQAGLTTTDRTRITGPVDTLDITFSPGLLPISCTSALLANSLSNVMRLGPGHYATSDLGLVHATSERSRAN